MFAEKINITRNLLHAIARHSKWNEASIHETLAETEIRPSLAKWLTFLDYIFLALGSALFVSGLFFFFAYNWDDMPKMAKLGLTQLPIVALGIFLLIKKTDNLPGKIALTALSCLVGLAFAVYGQIYQTGATAFDFLWGWSLLTLIWVVISDFPPLWMLYLILLNLTLGAYLAQYTSDLSFAFVSLLFIGLNLLAVVIFEWVSRAKVDFNIHRWFPQIVSGGIVIAFSYNIVFYIFDDNGYRNDTYGLPMLLLSIVALPAAFYYFYKVTQEIALVGLIPFCGICICAAAIVKVVNDDSIFLYLSIGIFVVIACGFLISFLTRFKKQLNAAAAQSQLL